MSEDCIPSVPPTSRCPRARVVERSVTRPEAEDQVRVTPVPPAPERYRYRGPQFEFEFDAWSAREGGQTLERAGHVVEAIDARLVWSMLGNGSVASKDPEGWKPKSGIDRGHLLGRQLGGDGSILENLVALYRGQNRGRMRVFEDKTAAAVRACEVVMYEVTPIYGGAALPVHEVDMIAVGNAGFLLVDTIPNQK